MREGGIKQPQNRKSNYDDGDDDRNCFETKDADD